MTTESKLKILCVEDDEDTCELMAFVFNDAGYEVETCSRVDCLKIVHEQKFAAIVLDNYFDGLSGVEVCRQIRSFDRKTPIIFLSGEVRETEIEKALAAGANAYLRKPSDFEKLVPTTLKLIEDSQTFPATEISG